MPVSEVRTAEEFDGRVLRAEEPTVVLFWAGWCPFCRAFRPAFDRAIEGRDERFVIVRLDEDSNPLWERYEVSVVPSLAFFRDGALVTRKDGRLGKGLAPAELDAFLGEVLPAAHPG
ncbi:MAG TPA: thioredoxin domain-containing protein [Thermoplasmata archaeon]|jgi:thioredoxin 1|nr:thioredoxin domain-containing protein [Thermoplasmata archaeon]